MKFAKRAHATPRHQGGTYEQVSKALPTEREKHENPSESEAPVDPDGPPTEDQSSVTESDVQAPAEDSPETAGGSATRRRQGGTIGRRHRSVPRTREHENPSNPKTPVDPDAPLRNGPPSVTDSAIPASVENSPQAAGDFTVFRNTDLGSGLGSVTNEPSVGGNGTNVLQTWNWRAAKSTNGGQSFTLVVHTAFPASYGGFCCDQLAYYEPTRDIYVWVLQYIRDANRNNASVSPLPRARPISRKRMAPASRTGILLRSRLALHRHLVRPAEDRRVERQAFHRGFEVQHQQS